MSNKRARKLQRFALFQPALTCKKEKKEYFVQFSGKPQRRKDHRQKITFQYHPITVKGSHQQSKREG